MGTNEMTEEGGLDLNTGVYTAPWPDTYSVTYSLQNNNGAGDNTVEMTLHKNGASLGDETGHYSDYTGSSGHYVMDQGGRTAILHLERGETVALYCDDCSAYVMRILFCVHLEDPDVI